MKKKGFTVLFLSMYAAVEIMGTFLGKKLHVGLVSLVQLFCSLE